MIGTNDERVEECIEVIKSHAKKRVETDKNAMPYEELKERYFQEDTE